VGNLAEAVKRGGLGEEAKILPLMLSTAEKQGAACLIWPAARPEAVLAAPAAGPATRATAPTKPQPVATKPPAPPGKPQPADAKPQPAATASKARAPQAPQLPPYTQSLLRIRVPVVVTLAENRQPLHRIVELGPGSIIQFDKSCEEMLQLSVGEHPLAQGEAVKVGDKFGLRITSIILPDERFRPVKPGHK
jgi:flagellar motor switch/type III secretory pathway protein FliN